MQQAEKIYNIENINSAVFNILGKSAEYKELNEKVTELEEDLLDIVDVQRKLKKSQKLNEAKAQLEQFKLDVIRLSEAFTKIEINTERIRLAKTHYESGNFEKANEVLIESELKSSQEILIQKKKKQEEELANQLKINADEWLMKARLTAINYNHSDRFETAKRYFESALLSSESQDTLLEYAYFLDANLQYNDAYNVILKAEPKPPPHKMESSVNNSPSNEVEFYFLKGKLEATLEMYNESEISYTKAQSINQNLVSQMAADVREWRLAILNGLSALYLKTGKVKLALKCAEEILETSEFLINSSLRLKAEFALAAKYKAFAIISLSKEEEGNTYKVNNLIATLIDFYFEIYDELAAENPDKYTLELITALEYKAWVQKSEINIRDAYDIFNKAIELARFQSTKNPMVYLPALSKILESSGEFYNNQIGHYEKSNSLILESLAIIEDLFLFNPAAYLYDLAYKQRAVAMTFDHLGKAHETLAYLKKSYDNFKLLKSKNAEIYNTEFVAAILKLAVRYRIYKEFESAEKSFQELQQEYWALTINGKEDCSWGYVNIFILLSEMFKDDCPNIQKSMFYANAGMEKVNNVQLSKVEYDDLNQRLSLIISHWQNDGKV